MNLLKAGRLLLKTSIVLIALATLSGLLNERHKRLQYAKYAQIGRSIDIGGRTLNIFCSGEGTPTVVFDTFSHQAGFSWTAVQPKVAAFTHACWYDRAGYGWSDDGPRPRTFKAVAKDLHALLNAARVPGPYVLVGSHDAASNIRVYNGLYPTDVAGVLLIDGNDIDVYAHHNDGTAPRLESIKGPWEKHFGSLAPYMRESACIVLPAATRLSGLMPKVGKRRPTLAYGFPADQREMLDFLSDRAFGESCDVKQNEADVRASGNFGNRPLIVLASGQQQIPRADNAQSVKEWNEWWTREVQPPLAALSTNGKLTVVPHKVDAESIIDALRDLVRQVRELQCRSSVVLVHSRSLGVIDVQKLDSYSPGFKAKT